MIQIRSMLSPADNSGAKRLMVIGISGKIGKKATIGDVVLCVVKGADTAGVVADHEKVRVLVVRTRKEVKLLTDARSIGVMTPKILHVEENKIVMEHIKGTRVKEFLNARNAAKTCKEIGKIIGKLHASNIVHGDLTTSNMILHDRLIYLIDFSLGDHSRKLEDKGTDIKLLKEALQSSHFKIFKTCWNNIVKGYKAEYADAGKVLEKVEEIERRARYRQHE